MKDRITRKEALALGVKFYHGRQCKHGHSGRRRVSNYACVECHNASSCAFGKDPENKEIIAERSKRHYDNNKENILARNRIYYKEDYYANKERYKGYMAKYRAKQHSEE